MAISRDYEKEKKRGFFVVVGNGTGIRALNFSMLIANDGCRIVLDSNILFSSKANL
jgi:hypothetical protein